MEGSTCIDGMATFKCICVEGLTGPRCEINIDDCEVIIGAFILYPMIGHIFSLIAVVSVPERRNLRGRAE
jgi:hypothetical protein